MIKDEDIEMGYSVCDCGAGIFLLQAGTDVELNMCSMCKSMVADRDEFFKFQDAVRVMSK